MDTTQAIQQYRELISECQKLLQKISELEMDRNEHLLVEETLMALDPKRRAYRLVGECLVERTVEEVLPTVASNRENVRAPSLSYYERTHNYLQMEKTIIALRERLDEQQTQAQDIKVKYNLEETLGR